jgi:hypothetical protein
MFLFYLIVNFLSFNDFLDQIINIQDPKCMIETVRGAMLHKYRTKGLSALWHGVEAGKSYDNQDTNEVCLI